MTRVVVTGASGYLGGAVVRAAAADPTVTVRSVVREPAAWLDGDVCVVDRLDPDTAAAAIDGADAVVHLAAPNEVATREHPDEALAATVSASRAVALACATAGVRRLIYVSTVHVYGAALVPGADIDETTLPAPRNPYAIARLASEHMVAAAAGATETVVFRLTNAIGAPADPGIARWTLVANDLCRQAAGGGPLRLLTAGYQWRDFISISDVAGILVAAAAPGRIDAGTYNLGSGVPMTIRDLAGLVAVETARAGLGQPVLEAPVDGADRPGPYCINIERLKAQGLVPTTPISAAVADTLAFCLSHRLAP